MDEEQQAKSRCQAGAIWWQQDGREALLEKLWADRTLTAPRIAALMGPGCTKNMVISKARRLGLEPRAVAPQKPGLVTVADAFKCLPTDGCRWPIGDPGTADFHFCGASSYSGRPYCGHHCAVAYVKVDSKGNAAAARAAPPAALRAQ